MKEIVLSEINPEMKELIVQFMVFNRMCIGDNVYIFKDKAFVFFTGIPYGFCGSLKIYTKKDDMDKFLFFMKNKHSIHCIDENSLGGKFFNRIERVIREGKINLLKVIVPEAYPIDFIYD